MTRWIDAPDWSDPIANTLLNALADAYPDPADAREVWRKIGMPQREFPLNCRNARQLWAAAAAEVSRAGLLTPLITTAQEEWPALRVQLADILTAPAQWFDSPAHLLDLTSDQEDELHDILDGATETASVPETYHDVRRTVIGLPPYPGDLWQAIVALRGAVDAMPLCEFLARMADGRDAVTSRRLWNWLRRTTPQWSLDIKELQRRSRLRKRTVLSVRVERDLLTLDLHVTVWIYSGSEGWQAAATGATPWSWLDVAERLSTLLREIESVRGGEPIVEFILPIDMLEAPVDKLVVELAAGAFEIGTICPVIVRPLCRPSSATHVEKWKALRESAERHDTGTSRMVRAASTGPDDLRTTLCAGIIRTRDTPPDVFTAALTAAFEAGVPVVLWHRATSFRYSNEIPLNAIMRERPAQDMQDVVFGQRQAAGNRDAPVDHPGRDVVLLWDNPHRKPPDITWLPPR